MATWVGTGVRIGLPRGWTVVPRPPGLVGVADPPRIDGLELVDDLDLVGVGDAELDVTPIGGVGEEQLRVVLVEQDGLLSWHLPDPRATEPAVAVPIRQGAGPAGLTASGAMAKVRAMAYRFVARAVVGLAVRSVVAVLEARRAEGPVVLADPNPANWTPSADLAALRGLHPARALLLVHGTFSSTRGSFAGLSTRIARMKARYDVVLGFDHPTLGRSPDENAAKLADTLLGWGEVPGKLDVVGYSRGGLVARALLHRGLPPAWLAAVDRVGFLATPNRGTRLASPSRWVGLVDHTTNLAAAVLAMAKLNPAVAAQAAAIDAVMAGVGVLLRALATSLLSPSDVPGLASMDPDGGWLDRLADAPLAHARYFGIAANHEPKGRLRGLADGAVDLFMGGDNDLVVPVAGVRPENLDDARMPVDLAADRSLHHLSLVAGRADALLTALDVPDPARGGVGLAVATQADDAGASAAVEAARSVLVRFPRELPDDEAERLLAIEAGWPGTLDAVRLGLAARPEAGAPPDRFSAPAEARTLAKTVRDRFAYDTPAAGPELAGDLVRALLTPGPARVTGSARALSSASDPTGARLLGTFGLGDRWTAPPPPPAGLAAETLYWCGAGRTLRGVIGDLVEDRRALANMGSGAFQTVAGAFSTGTHGSGIGLGAVHTLIGAIAVATFHQGAPVVRFLQRADAPVCDPARFPGWAAGWAAAQGLSEVPTLVTDTDRFVAHVLGLGCLGVILGVAIRTLPEYQLAEQRSSTTWNVRKHGLLDEVSRSRHYELLLSPWPDGQGDHRCLEIRRKDTALTEPEGGRPIGMKLASEGVARGIVGLLMEAAIKDPLDALPKRADTSIEETLVPHYVDRWDQVLRLNLNVASLTGEYGVAASGAVAAIEALLGLCRERIAAARDYLQAHPGDVDGMWRNHPVPAGPIAVRFVQRDDVPLSPMFGRDAAMLEFHHPGSWELDARLVAPPSRDEDRRMARYRAYDAGRRRLLADAESLLIRDHDARPHWGLYNTLDQARARAAFPGFDAWMAVYDEVNAEGRFNGRITRALGIDRGGA